MRKSGLLLASAAFAMVVLCGTVWADIFAVTNTKDSGSGSLRTAIVRANDNPGRDVITFSPGARGEIRLKSALPGLRGEVEIRGPGSGRLTVRRAAASDFRVFNTAPNSTVRISGLSISNGLADGFGCCNEADNGGGVFNEGTLTLRGVVVSSNRADGRGGGISNVTGARLTVEDSTFSSNNGGGIDNGGSLTVRNSTFSANDGGGLDTGGNATVTGSTFVENQGSGIFNNGQLTVGESTFSRNNTDGWGGAISNDFAELTVEGSTFSGNTADSGGAISAFEDNTTVTDSTFSGNTARFNGGAIRRNGGGSLTVERSTFVANEAGDRGGGITSFEGSVTLLNTTFSKNVADYGGGAYSDPFASSLAVRFSTFANNEATVKGGGIINDTIEEDFVFCSLRATIVARNQAPEGPDVSGPCVSGGYNLIGNPSGSTGFGPTDLTNTSPRLDPRGLSDNGGPTRTIALTAASPAIDAVAEGCPPPATDQRGVRRPQNGDGEGGALCDIGAFERNAPALP